MIRMIDVLKRGRVGRALVIALCASVLVATTPRRADADLIEYTLLLAFVALASAALFDQAPAPTDGASRVLIGQLQTSVESASNAFSQGDVNGQITGLSQAIGVATALAALTSTCDDCGDLTSTLDKIIAGASTLRATLLGNSSPTCNPTLLVC